MAQTTTSEQKEGVKDSVKEFLAKGGKITQCKPGKGPKNEKINTVLSNANNNIINTRSK
jgi:hypothetical protein